MADSIFARMKGLLGRKELKSGQALVLKPCDSVHTFFMQFAIDVLFVDKHNKVVGAASNLLPFRLSPLFFRAAYAIELPAGVISSTATAKGDSILLADQ